MKIIDFRCFRFLVDFSSEYAVFVVNPPQILTTHVATSIAGKLDMAPYFSLKIFSLSFIPCSECHWLLLLLSSPAYKSTL